MFFPETFVANKIEQEEVSGFSYTSMSYDPRV